MNSPESSMVLVAEFLATKNSNYFIATFVDTEEAIGDELHITQFTTRLVTKSNKERYEKLQSKGTNVLMNTTPRD